MPRAKHWTDQEILDALRSWADKHGRSPRWTDWKLSEPDHPTSVTVWERCGSWNDALEMAGLEPNEPYAALFMKRTFDRDTAREMRREGISDAEIARQLGVGSGAIGKALGARHKVMKPPLRKPKNAAEARERRIEALKKALINQ